MMLKADRLGRLKPVPEPRTVPARMLTMKEAACYCRLPYNFFRVQVKNRIGPDFIEVSARSKFFERSDLDRWMQNWNRTDYRSDD